MTQKLVTLEDARLRQLLANPTVVSEFTFMRGASKKLKAIKPKRGGCGGCRKKSAVTNMNMNGVKQGIAALPVDKKLRLKKLLNADTVRLYYQNGKGQRVKLTF
jgi:hypothetical protein